jgi:hypothetical protein
LVVQLLHVDRKQRKESKSQRGEQGSDKVHAGIRAVQQFSKAKKREEKGRKDLESAKNVAQNLTSLVPENCTLIYLVAGCTSSTTASRRKRAASSGGVGLM